MTSHRTDQPGTSLTEYMSRHAFMDAVQRTMDPGREDEQPVSLLLFDVDRLKAVNQAFGHTIGDQVIRILADRLNRVMRPIDTAGRVNGAEFAVLLPQCSARTAFAIADQVRAAFQDDAQSVNSHQVGATVSVGTATKNQTDGSQPDILTSAQNALNQAKTMGGNRVSQADKGTRRTEP